MANSIVSTVKIHHTVDWIHMPVPRNRTDKEYFAPLQDLHFFNDTRLYLGLVHSHEEKGTLLRIEAAHAGCGLDFGVAAECGMGRTPQEELASMLEISRAVTAAHK